VGISIMAKTKEGRLLGHGAKQNVTIQHFPPNKKTEKVSIVFGKTETRAPGFPTLFHPNKFYLKPSPSKTTMNALSVCPCSPSIVRHPGFLCLVTSSLLSVPLSFGLMKDWFSPINYTITEL